MSGSASKAAAAQKLDALIASIGTLTAVVTQQQAAIAALQGNPVAVLPPPPTVTADGKPVIPDGTPNPSDVYGEPIRTTDADRLAALAEQWPDSDRAEYPLHKMIEEGPRKGQIEKDDRGNDKQHKVAPKARRHFVRQLAASQMVCELVVRIRTAEGKPTDQVIGVLSKKRYKGGNHGIAASKTQTAIMFPDGSAYTLSGGVNLMLETSMMQQQDHPTQRSGITVSGKANP